MKTEELEKFLYLNDTTLSNIEGGNLSAGEVGNAFGICATAGAIIGGAFGAVPGALGGAVLGAQYCGGTWVIIRTH